MYYLRQDNSICFTFITENICWLKIGTTKWRSGCFFFFFFFFFFLVCLEFYIHLVGSSVAQNDNCQSYFDVLWNLARLRTKVSANVSPFSQNLSKFTSWKAAFWNFQRSSSIRWKVFLLVPCLLDSVGVITFSDLPFWHL